MTPWTKAHQAPLSMGFSRKEHWRGLPSPLPGDLLDPGVELMSPTAPALADGFLSLSHPGSPEQTYYYISKISIFAFEFRKHISKMRKVTEGGRGKEGPVLSGNHFKHKVGPSLQNSV